MRELEALLGQLEEAGQNLQRVSVGDLRRQLGSDAFGPALLVLALFLLSPIGDIPGAPTTLGLFILLIAGQLAAGRQSFWLPGFLLRRSMKTAHLAKAVRFIRPVGRFVGALIRPRLAFLTEGAYARGIAAVCCLLTLCLPPMEFVPFASLAPAVALTAFALALVARDGLLASLALAFTGGAFYLVARLL